MNRSRDTYILEQFQRMVDNSGDIIRCICNR
jgi:hypothetical protein